MPTAEVVNVNREKVGTIELDDRLFGSKINRPLIHEAVVMQRASMRLGSAATKSRGEVRGGGRKPWKQKGTGRARAGSSRSPLWRGGGTTFGPVPRKYGYAFPRKKYRLALQGVLTAKFKDGEVIIVDQIELTEPKTKQMVQILKKLNLPGKILIVIKETNQPLMRAARNIEGVKLVTVGGLNVYDLLRATHVLMPRELIPQVQEAWS